MEIILTIYFTINVFLSGFAFCGSIDDGDTHLQSATYLLLYMVFGVFFLAILVFGLLATMVVDKYNNLKEKKK